MSEKCLFACTGGKGLPDVVTYTGSLTDEATNGYGGVTGQAFNTIQLPTLGYKKATITATMDWDSNNKSSAGIQTSSGVMILNARASSITNKEYDISNDTFIKIWTSGRSTQNVDNGARIYVKVTYTITLHN